MPCPVVAVRSIRFEDYVAFAPRWRDQIANVKTHEITRERPVNRFQRERSLPHALPWIPFDTDKIVPTVVTPMHDRVPRAIATRCRHTWCTRRSRFAPMVDKIRILH